MNGATRSGSYGPREATSGSPLASRGATTHASSAVGMAAEGQTISTRSIRGEKLEVIERVRERDVAELARRGFCAQKLRLCLVRRSEIRTGVNSDDARHILEEVEAVADTVLLVVNGRLAAAGDHHGIRAALDDRPYHVRVIANAPDGRQPDAPRGRRLGAVVADAAAVVC